MLTLLLILMFIATASAAIYNYMYIQVTPIGVESPKIRFVTGADSTAAGASIGTNGTYVIFNSMAGWPNATRIYEDAVGIKNFNATGTYTIELKFDQAADWSGDTSQVDYINVKLFDATDTQQGSTINVGTAGSSTGAISISAGATWRVQWEIKWNANAQATHNVSVKLTLIVAGE